ncbi:hypothetical protein F5888DRAFT_1803643 [Russula emetica]|nr:hypothetical protein F5888DRAFT_1803643 [Russula emetica]
MNQLKGHAADLFVPTSQNIRVSGSPRIPASYSITRRLRGNRAKHLVRVATEYTQLLYHVSKAQADARSAFVDEIQWRISRIQSTLSSDLDHLFSNTVTALGTGKLAETDKAKHIADLIECLRTYDALQLWRDAEDVLWRDVLREFVKKTIFPGAIQTPHPPFIPPTPVPIHEKVSFSDTARTPYAPFTAFSTQTDPFNAALAVAPRLDETDNSLAVLYNDILTFLDRDLKHIMDVAERISARIRREPHNSTLNNRVPSPPRPPRHVTPTPPRRASATSAVAVYFQLRWKDIVTCLEDSLSTNKLEPESSLKKGLSAVRFDFGMMILTMMMMSNASHVEWGSRLGGIVEMALWTVAATTRLKGTAAKARERERRWTQGKGGEGGNGNGDGGKGTAAEAMAVIL